jgi:glycosyltransferase involved in cell wall biosynthesis
MTKIVIDSTAIASKRGSGFYSERLFEALQAADQKKFKFDLLNIKKISAEKLKQFDIIHYPYFDPFFLTLPLKKFKPTIVTVHDLIPLKFPKYFPCGLRGSLKWLIQRYSLNKTKAIITDSDTSRDDINKITKICPDKIHRIYLASDKRFKPISKVEALRITQRFVLPKKFILYVGDLNWNKNIPGLLKSFFGTEPFKNNVHLVVIGKSFLKSKLVERKQMMSLINKLKLSKYIHFLGYIQTEELNALYNLALCYCQPSFYEGFGLPVLEAMSCGCPVVCSNNSSLAEIAGNAAKFVDVDQEQQLQDALNEFIGSEKERKDFSQEGLKRAKDFSWEKTAEETMKVYDSVL